MRLYLFSANALKGARVLFRSRRTPSSPESFRNSVPNLAEPCWASRARTWTAAARAGLRSEAAPVWFRRESVEFFWLLMIGSGCHVCVCVRRCVFYSAVYQPACWRVRPRLRTRLLSTRSSCISTEWPFKPRPVTPTTRIRSSITYSPLAPSSGDHSYHTHAHTGAVTYTGSRASCIHRVYGTGARGERTNTRGGAGAGGVRAKRLL